MHKRSLRRFAVVTGAALITGATAVPAMATLSIGSSSGLLSESKLADDLVPTALPALPASAPLVSPILGSNFALVGANSLLPKGIENITGLVPSTTSLLVLALGAGALVPTTTVVNLATSTLGLATSPTGPVNVVLNTVIGGLGVLNPSSSAIGGVLGSM